MPAIQTAGLVGLVLGWRRGRGRRRWRRRGRCGHGRGGCGRRRGLGIGRDVRVRCVWDAALVGPRGPGHDRGTDHGAGGDACRGRSAGVGCCCTGRTGSHGARGTGSGHARDGHTGGQRRFEGIGQDRGGRPAILRVERERASDDGREVRRHGRADEHRVRDRPGQPGQRDRCSAVALPRSRADEHLVQDDAEAVDVRGGGRGLAACLLRAEVVDRAEGRTGQRDLCLGDGPRDAEVDDLDLAVLADEHVAGLDVAVHEAPCVGRRERPGDRGPDAGDLPRRQRPAPAQDRREVLAVDQLHDDVRAARVLAVVVHGHDVRVAERRGRLGLLAEARREVGVAQVLGSEELEGDVAAEPGVRGAIDGRHPAAAEKLDQTVATAQDLPDLRQIVPSPWWPSRGRDVRCGGIVPHERGRQSWSVFRYARNSVPRSGRVRAISTEALSQPIVVPAS